MRKLFLLILCIPFVAVAEVKEAGIHVKGEASIDVPADLVEIGFRVVGEATELPAAKADVDKRASMALRKITALGIKEKNISSEQINIQRQFDYDGNRNRRFKGYQVSRRIRVKVLDVVHYNEAINALTTAGIDEIDQVTPAISEKDAIKQQALKRATENALQKAKLLAKTLGVKVGAVYRISETRVQSNFEMTHRAQASQAKLASDWEFKPSSVDISAEVWLDFEIAR